MIDAVPPQISARYGIAGRPTYSRTMSVIRVTMRIVPSKKIMQAIWKFGFLKTLSLLPILFNVRS